MLEQLSSDNQDSQENWSSDKLLQQARKHLKQVLQQVTNLTVQLELENSIKSLDQARFIANLDSLKQPEEAFQKKSGVQEWLDDFKKKSTVNWIKFFSKCHKPKHKLQKSQHLSSHNYSRQTPLSQDSQL